MRRLPFLLLTAALAGGLSPEALAVEPDIRLISQGREVALEQHLVPGKLVVFDFYADWCAPCRSLTPQLERLATQHPERLALRKIDVIDWESPVSRQHGIASLPHLVLFGPDGVVLAEGDAGRVLRTLASHLGLAAPVPSGSGAASAALIGVAAVLLVAGAALLRRRAAPLAGAQPEAAAGGSPRIWLVMTSRGLEGPLSLQELAERSRSIGLDGGTRVRRQGEAVWRRLDDVLGTS